MYKQHFREHLYLTLTTMMTVTTTIMKMKNITITMMMTTLEVKIARRKLESDPLRGMESLLVCNSY